MGTIGFDYNELIREKDNIPALKLSAIVGADSFFYLVENQQGGKVAAKGFSFPEKYHDFYKPAGYLTTVFA